MYCLVQPLFYYTILCCCTLNLYKTVLQNNRVDFFSKCAYYLWLYKYRIANKTMPGWMQPPQILRNNIHDPFWTVQNGNGCKLATGKKTVQLSNTREQEPERCSFHRAEYLNKLIMVLKAKLSRCKRCLNRPGIKKPDFIFESCIKFI